MHPKCVVLPVVHWHNVALNYSETLTDSTHSQLTIDPAIWENLYRIGFHVLFSTLLLYYLYGQTYHSLPKWIHESHIFNRKQNLCYIDFLIYLFIFILCLIDNKLLVIFIQLFLIHACIWYKSFSSCWSCFFCIQSAQYLLSSHQIIRSYLCDSISKWTSCENQTFFQLSEFDCSWSILQENSICYFFIWEKIQLFPHAIQKW